jgi:hypothetical protein
MTTVVAYLVLACGWLALACVVATVLVLLVGVIARVDRFASPADWRRR